MRTDDDNAHFRHKVRMRFVVPPRPIRDNAGTASGPYVSLPQEGGDLWRDVPAALTFDPGHGKSLRGEISPGGGEGAGDVGMLGDPGLAHDRRAVELLAGMRDQEIEDARRITVRK